MKKSLIHASVFPKYEQFVSVREKNYTIRNKSSGNIFLKQWAIQAETFLKIKKMHLVAIRTMLMWPQFSSNCANNGMFLSKTLAHFQSVNIFSRREP